MKAINFLVLIFIFSVMLGSDLCAQQNDFIWAVGTGDSRFKEVHDITVDESGNIFITGFVQTSSKMKDIYLAKFDLSGKKIWQRLLGGNGDDEGKGIAFSSGGYLYLTGYFQDRVDFGKGYVQTQGGEDIFVAKYDTIGQLIWVSTGGGASEDSGLDIVFDHIYSEVIVTGTFTGDATFFAPNQSPQNIAGTGSSDCFVVKYNFATGNILMLESFGGAQAERPFGVTVGVNKNIYITGEFYGTTDFGSTTLSSSGASDIFLAKYRQTFFPLWAVSAGDVSHDYGMDAAVDALENVFVCGSLSDGMYLAKYNSSGELLWQEQADGGTSSGRGIAIDSEGNIIVVGEFNGDITFGHGSSSIKLNSEANNVFIAQYDSSGNLMGVKKTEISNGEGQGQGIDIVIDNFGNIFITGNYNGTITFNTPGSSTSLSSDNRDIFIAKVGLVISAPYAPSLISPHNGTMGADINQVFKWNSSARAVSYHFQLDQDVKFSSLMKDESDLSDTTYTVSEMEKITIYVWRVKAANVAGESEWSEVFLFSTVPVELASFAAKIHSQEMNNFKVILKWLTASETNNYGFDIERSDTEEWKKIGFVKGYGTTAEPHHYEFIDNLSNIAFDIPEISYRLKQIDFDGTFEYSQIINVDLNSIPKRTELFQNYPNPFNPFSTISYSIAKSSFVTLTIYDVLGREVEILVKEFKEAGKYNLSFEINELSNGVYFYKLDTGDFVDIKKMIFMR